MELVIAPSARKHGVSDEDMIHAYRNPIRLFQLDDGFTMLVGPDHAARPIEVGVIEAADGTLVIVHAMRPARPKVPEVMPMPRTVEEILASADQLAKKFEDYEPQPGDAIDGAPLQAVREGFEDLALAQKRLSERVSVARAAGHSWASIGAMMGTSGEAARQRYGAKDGPAKKAAPTKKAAPGKVAGVKRSTTTRKVTKTAASGRFVAGRRNSA